MSRPTVRPPTGSPSRARVVIVGAGPVGVTAALLLGRHGVSTVLLERHRDVYPLPRAVAMDDEVHRILQAAGVHEDFARLARPGRGLRLLDGRHRVMAEFRRDRADGHHGFPELSMFDQPVFERMLRRALAARPESELRGGAEVLAVDQTPDDPRGPVRVSYRRDGSDEPVQLWADAVLGCDGANSLTRAAIGATWRDLRFEERWMVLDARTTAPVRCWEGVDQVCDPARAATFMRITEDRYRWEFRLRDDEDLDAAVTPENLRTLVAPWVAVTDATDFAVVRAAQYTFRARTADRWRQGRVFLLGDAAHLTPPFIGQGMGAGLRDARNLAWKLARVLDGGADDALLDTYQSEREPHARRLIRMAVATGWAMTGGQDRAAAVRRTVLTTAFRLPGLAGAATRGMIPPLRPGPLVRRGRPPRRPGLPGTLCPQPWVVLDGRRLRLDDVLGDSFAVLAAAPLPPATRAAATALDAVVVQLDPASARPGDLVVADDGTLAAWLRRGRARAVIVRPDRVVLAAVPVRTRSRPDTGWAALLGSTAPATAPAPDPVLAPDVMRNLPR